MRFYYFDFSLLDPTRLLKNLGKSFSGGRPGGGGCVGDRKGKEQALLGTGEGAGRGERWAEASWGGGAQQGLEERARVKHMRWRLRNKGTG
jgi:hypothetical protein